MLSNIIPLVNKNEQGKLTRFIPLQRHLLLLLRETQLFKGHGYMGLCLVHDYYLCLDKPIEFKPQDFCNRWGISLSFFYKGRKELIKQGLIRISKSLSKTLVTVCSQLVRCPKIEHPQGSRESDHRDASPWRISQEEELFAEDEFSNWTQEILQVENENDSNPLPANVLGDSLDINIREEIKYNKRPPNPPRKKIDVEVGYQTMSTSFEVQPIVYHCGQSNMEGIKEEGGNGGWLVIQDGEEINPVLFGNSQPTSIPMQVEIMQPIPISVTLLQIPTQAEDNQLTSLPTKTILPSTPQTPHDDHLPGGGNDSPSEAIEVEWMEEVSSVVPDCARSEVVEAEIVVEVVEDVAQKTDILVVVVEGEKLQGGCSSLQPSGEVEYSPQVQRAIDLYEHNGIIPRVHELNMWAEVEIGEYVKLYRKSGRILSSKPNDIVVGFRKFLIETKKAANPIAWISAMEKSPMRWGELADMVQEWQKKEFINSDEGKKLKMEYYENTGLGVTGRWQLD